MTFEEIHEKIWTTPKHTFALWKNALPLNLNESAQIHWFPPENRISDCAIIAIPGGAYRGLSQYDGIGYGNFFSMKGISMFSVNYHTAPNKFPIPLLEARRAVRYVRAHAKEFGIDPKKIAVLGSSAGGHLVALLSNCTYILEGERADDIDEIDFLPNAQILCYPVICSPLSDPNVCHYESYKNLLGGRNEELERLTDPLFNIKPNTPPAFIWHTAADKSVNLINSFRYAESLCKMDIPVELHVFPYGHHGLGVSYDVPHNRQWTELLINWLGQLGWLY